MILLVFLKRNNQALLCKQMAREKKARVIYHSVRRYYLK